MRPIKDDLQRLYVDEFKTTRQIAAIYGVKHISVRRWLANHGIPIRPASRGLSYRGIQPPSKDELVEMIHVKHMSYEQIAGQFGVDKTAVSYWLAKHEIERPKTNVTRTKGRVLEIIGSDVQELYDSGMSLKKIAIRYGVNEFVIRRICKESGIETRAPGFTGETYTADDGTIVRSVYEIRVANWLASHGIRYSYEPSYPRFRSLKADFMANGWFIEIWGVEGNERYNRRKESKIQLCKSFGIPLVQLNYWHFDARSEHVLERILSQVLVEAHTQGMLF